MIKRYYLVFCGLLLLVSGSMQAQDEFNPNTPAEPQVPVFSYPLTVTCTPAGAANTSGKGNYAPGTSVTVSTSPKAGYVFDHWELNGATHDAAGPSFSYTTVAGAMDFVAVYDFTPNDPSEPTLNVKSHLFLASEPEGVCTFNRTSGAFVGADQYVTVNVTGVDQLYEFTGWYLNGTKLTDAQEFNYLMNYDDVTLVAHFNELPFEPSTPLEPSSSANQTDIQQHATGDANRDGVVNVSDAVAVINVYLTGNTDSVSPWLSDANGDGVINISDAVYVINTYLNNQ